jgi:hypothetical protein
MSMLSGVSIGTSCLTRQDIRLLQAWHRVQTEGVHICMLASAVGHRQLPALIIFPQNSMAGCSSNMINGVIGWVFQLGKQ